jgi:hypothetical protein
MKITLSCRNEQGNFLSLTNLNCPVTIGYRSLTNCNWLSVINKLLFSICSASGEGLSGYPRRHIHTHTHTYTRTHTYIHTHNKFIYLPNFLFFIFIFLFFKKLI